MFDVSQKLIASLQASNNRSWVTDENTYNLGTLITGDRIYFAVDKGKNGNYWWDTTEIAWTVTSTRDKSSEVCRESDVSVPENFAIKQNYPNPFNPATTIGYQLSAVNDFELVIYNKLGKIVRSLVSEVRPEGAYKINWDGCDNTGEPVSTDVYLYCLKAGSFIQAHKMVLLR